MPSVRFSRDKRGYEYVYLVHTPIRRGKPGRSRVLYWYRTPPGMRIGRQPFDEEVQRSLERQNPGVSFDWPTIINTPMPPPDMTEFWRERRKAEKAARQERRAAEALDAEETGEAAQPTPPEAVPVVEDAFVAELAIEELNEVSVLRESDRPDPEGEPPTETSAGPDAEGQLLRKRRRRRGGRRRKGPAGESSAETAGGGTEPDGPTEGQEDSQPGDIQVAEAPSEPAGPASEEE